MGDKILSIFGVAPFAGAWIEIYGICQWHNSRKTSLPLRERGLKYSWNGFTIIWVMVAPFAGAWIEMEIPNIFRHILKPVAPFAGAWIEILHSAHFPHTFTRRSLCGSVDWNSTLPWIVGQMMSRSLCGSVDWNTFNKTHTRTDNSRSLCGSVDWNFASWFW